MLMSECVCVCVCRMLWNMNQRVWIPDLGFRRIHVHTWERNPEHEAFVKNSIRTIHCQLEFYILSLQGHKTNPYYIHNTD